MFQGGSEFVWEVPRTGGYAWAKCRFSDEVVDDALVPLDGTTFDRYAPLASGIALHRELAKTELTKEGVLAFSNRFGNLGRGADDHAEVLPAPGIAARLLAPVERFAAWRRIRVWLREAVRVWDMVQDGNDDGLAEVIKWQSEGVVHYRPPRQVLAELGTDSWPEGPYLLPQARGGRLKGYDLLATATGANGLGRHIRRGDLVRPAVIFVHSLINDELWFHVGPVLVWDYKRNRTIRQDMPRSLLGAIYLSFAQEVMFQRKPRQCTVCGTWFELSPVAGRSLRRTRSDRETCSSACRSKAYRLRQESARQSFLDGQSVKAIAKALGCKPAVVKGWVKNVRRGE
jgi:hypothetical protein